MANEENQATIDKNHGFMKFILKNQYDRDRYDKEQKLRKLSVNSCIDSVYSSSEKIINESLKNDNNITATSNNRLLSGEERVKNTNRIDFSSLRLDSKAKIDLKDLKMLKIDSSEEKVYNTEYENKKEKEKRKEFLLDHFPSKLGKNTIFFIYVVLCVTCTLHTLLVRVYFLHEGLMLLREKVLSSYDRYNYNPYDLHFCCFLEQILFNLEFLTKDGKKILVSVKEVN